MRWTSFGGEHHHQRCHREIDTEFDGQARPLTALPKGKSGMVVALAGGNGLRRRIVSMGLNVGCEVRTVRSSGRWGGPVLVACAGSRLAIGRGMADKILVEIEPDTEPE